MRRREFVVSLGVAAPLFVGPRVARAQQAQVHRMRRLGVLKYTSESDQTSKAGAETFEAELARLGWRRGASVRFDYRFGDGDASRTAAFAKELVGLAPDAIVSRGTPATRALLQETRTLPIVFVSVSDPVGDRFVDSIARPGGNVTGFTNLEAAVAGKWLELLKEVAPDTRRVAALFNPDVATAGGTFYLRAITDAAPSFGVSVDAIEVRTTGEIEGGREAFARTPGSGLVGMPDPSSWPTAR
jgi:putative tryptophan/tyrosine transport system substrate-binding protein